MVFSGGFRKILKGVEGLDNRCLAKDVIPLEFHTTLETGAQHEGKEQPMVCRIPATHGGGFEEANGDVEICLPRDICVLHVGNDSDLDVLIDCIFPRFNENMSDKNYITSQALC